MDSGSVSKKVFLFVLVIAIVSSGLAYYFYRQMTVVNVNPQQATQAEIQSLLAKVGQLILLPQNEIPTVATVADPDQLKSQPFFANAKKGDKLLIYTNARKAILYDPVENRIIEVAPVNIGSNTPSTNTNATTSTTKTK